ncbi:MAG: hypothetical protein CR217_09385 [Beijerinckiaceae bacterium]|nr:MAG: hypothetical protein CR217_09385 [Beijerinckiaceae bacterium]
MTGATGGWSDRNSERGADLGGSKARELRESYLSDIPRINSESRNSSSMKNSMKLTVVERNTLIELAHLLNEGLGDIAVTLAEPWLQDAQRNAPRMTALIRRRAGLRALCNATRGLSG